jgi:hypothetical protein
MPQPRIGLPTFATALGQHLPGQWYRKYEGFPAPKDHRPVADRVWDCGPANSAVLDFPDAPIALLDGPDGEQLCVIERPRYARQYLVVPLEPEGFKPHHLSGVDEPNGIAVPDDPVRAAAAITRRVLPRYRQALDAVRLKARTQPEPPRRPAAAEVEQTLTLVWYPDGVVGAPYASVPAEARTVLYSCYFQYSPHESAFVLPASYNSIDRALLLQRALRQLTYLGIGVNFRQAQPITALATSAARPARALHSATQAPPAARR